MKAKRIILAARALSLVFTPFYLPIVGLVVLLTFSYLSLLPLVYKLFLLFTFWLSTVIIPTALIRLYRHYQGWTRLQLGNRERRMIPYVISILSYMMCYYFMALTHVPRFMGSVLIAALVVQVACAIVNVWVKVSTHTAAIGGMAGALVAFSLIFSFNPVWWLCLIILVSGLVGTSRMILRQHSLGEVVGGFLLGLCCACCSMLLF